MTTSVIVDEFVLRRTREIKQWDMGIRHMNASSDAYRSVSYTHLTLPTIYSV